MLSHCLSCFKFIFLLGGGVSRLAVASVEASVGIAIFPAGVSVIALEFQLK